MFLTKIFFGSINFMVISGNYKNNYDIAITTAHNSMGFDTKGTP